MRALIIERVRIDSLFFTPHNYPCLDVSVTVRSCPKQASETSKRIYVIQSLNIKIHTKVVKNFCSRYKKATNKLFHQSIRAHPQKGGEKTSLLTCHAISLRCKMVKQNFRSCITDSPFITNFPLIQILALTQPAISLFWQKKNKFSPHCLYVARMRSNLLF